MPDNKKQYTLHDYQLLLKEAFRYAGLPTSVRVSAYDESTKEIKVGRYKLPSQLWKGRQLTISFKDWPNVTLHCTYLKSSEKINMAVPDTVSKLGRRIGKILGV
jgi:hypothetical protein